MVVYRSAILLHNGKPIECDYKKQMVPPRCRRELTSNTNRCEFDHLSGVKQQRVIMLFAADNQLFSYVSYSDLRATTNGTTELWVQANSAGGMMRQIIHMKYSILCGLPAV